MLTLFAPPFDQRIPIMFPVERALLIINRNAGTGQGEAMAEKLALLFKHGLDQLVAGKGRTGQQSC